MAITIEHTNTQSPNYNLIELLLHQAFPIDERRNDAQQRLFTDNNSLFFCNAILSDNKFVGLLNYWNSNNFVYIEHLAINQSVRSTGYGSMAIETFCKMVDKPIIIEVELPSDATAISRIKFYERNGFSVWSRSKYTQPAYEKGLNPLPMHIMSHGDIDECKMFDTVRKSIYKNVYGVE